MHVYKGQSDSTRRGEGAGTSRTCEGHHRLSRLSGLAGGDGARDSAGEEAHTTLLRKDPRPLERPTLRRQEGALGERVRVLRQGRVREVALVRRAVQGLQRDRSAHVWGTVDSCKRTKDW